MRNKGDRGINGKIELRMISGLHVVKQLGKVVLFPSDYVWEEIQEVYTCRKGMTTPGLLFEDLPIHNSYDQFPYLRTY